VINCCCCCCIVLPYWLVAGWLPSLGLPHLPQQTNHQGLEPTAGTARSPIFPTELSSSSTDGIITVAPRAKPQPCLISSFSSFRETSVTHRIVVCKGNDQSDVRQYNPNAEPSQEGIFAISVNARWGRSRHCRVSVWWWCAC